MGEIIGNSRPDAAACQRPPIRFSGGGRVRECGIVGFGRRDSPCDSVTAPMPGRIVVVTRDPAGNRKLDKSKATARIDGMVALAMAFGLANKTAEATQAPEYRIFFL